MERLSKSDVKYRFVIDIASTLESKDWIPPASDGNLEPSSVAPAPFYPACSVTVNIVPQKVWFFMTITCAFLIRFQISKSLHFWSSLFLDCPIEKLGLPLSRYLVDLSGKVKWNCSNVYHGSILLTEIMFALCLIQSIHLKRLEEFVIDSLTQCEIVW
jgi:hypothetical protein